MFHWQAKERRGCSERHLFSSCSKRSLERKMEETLWRHLSLREITLSKKIDEFLVLRGHVYVHRWCIQLVKKSHRRTEVNLTRWRVEKIIQLSLVPSSFVFGLVPGSKGLLRLARLTENRTRKVQFVKGTNTNRRYCNSICRGRSSILMRILSHAFSLSCLFFFFRNTTYFKKPQVISGRGWGRGPHPLHSFPRFLSEESLCVSGTLKKNS